MKSPDTFDAPQDAMEETMDTHEPLPESPGVYVREGEKLAQRPGLSTRYEFPHIRFMVRQAI